MTSTLDTHIINPTKTSIGSVIWMHGLGANHHDFDRLVPDLCFDNQLPLKFIFPNAPIRPVAINHNAPMRAWYDVYSLTDLQREDEAGIAASKAAITELVQQEIQQGVPAERIVIAGFSQGGAIALHTGMQQTQPIGGILALSCYLPLLQKHINYVHPNNLESPIFMAHGTHDMTLPCFAGKMSYDIIRQTHPNAQWMEYPMGHEISPQEIDDIRHWLARIFS